MPAVCGHADLRNAPFDRGCECTIRWFKMVDPDQVNVVDRAWTLGVTWMFGTNDD